jgi:hypothetical protein
MQAMDLARNPTDKQPQSYSALAHPARTGPAAEPVRRPALVYAPEKARRLSAGNRLAFVASEPYMAGVAGTDFQSPPGTQGDPVEKEDCLYPVWSKNLSKSITRSNRYVKGLSGVCHGPFRRWATVQKRQLRPAPERPREPGWAGLRWADLTLGGALLARANSAPPAVKRSLTARPVGRASTAE